MSVIIRGKNSRKPHTVRYWADGRQRERSFATAGEARDFKIKTDHDVRAHIFTDARDGRELFGEAAGRWLASRPLAPSSRAAYTAVYRTHLAPVLGSRTLSSVAADRDGVTALLTRDMAHLSHAQVAQLAGDLKHSLAIWLMRGGGLRVAEAWRSTGRTSATAAGRCGSHARPRGTAGARCH
jgi:hypothetical protein